MEQRLQLFFIIAVIMYLIIIIHLLRKKKLNLKYTLLWLISAVILLIVTIFPNAIFVISELIGIATPINSALVLAGMFIIIILIMLTSIVSKLNHDQRVLTQEIAILQKKIREMSMDHKE